MTFSIVARDLQTGEWGVAVQSKFVAIGALTPWAKASIGAIATQAWINTSYGSQGLEWLERGYAPPETITLLTKVDLVRRISNEGYEIGNHTMHHPDLRTLPDQGACTELNQADQVLSSLTGVTTRPYYRPPYGGRDNRVRNLAAHIGYRTVYWTIDTLDWQTTATPASITRIVMDHLTNGAIILMHAGSQVESETLDGLMTKIEQMRYQIVTVTQVLQ